MVEIKAVGSFSECEVEKLKILTSWLKSLSGRAQFRVLIEKGKDYKSGNFCETGRFFYHVIRKSDVYIIRLPDRSLSDDEIQEVIVDSWLKMWRWKFGSTKFFRIRLENGLKNYPEYEARFRVNLPV